jgi:hypothetical protein
MAIVMLSRAAELLQSNPTPAEQAAAYQLVDWAAKEVDQMVRDRRAANQNWEQCVLLKGNYETYPMPNTAPKPAPPQDNPCGAAPSGQEFVVTPELAAKLDALGIGRLEFQGRVQAGDWDWVRSSLGITSGSSLTADQAAEANQLLDGMTAPSGHATAEGGSASAPLTADTLLVSSAPVPAPRPPDSNELRQAGIVPLTPPLNIFGFAGRQFANWHQSHR